MSDQVTPEKPIDPVAVLETARAQSPAAALPVLLELWRALPAPELAAAIAALGQAAAAAAPLPTRGTHDERHRAWLELEAECDASGLTLLLDAWPLGRVVHATEQLERLAARPRDPRLTEALLALFDDPPYRQSRPFWTCVLGVLEQLADPRSLDAQLHERAPRAFAQKMGQWLDRQLAARLPQLQAQITTRPRDLTDEARASCRALARSVQSAPIRSGGDPEALLAAIYADPDDPTHRQVYADLLSELGDLRGELIVLQLQRAEGGCTRDQARRERALLKEQGAAWLGPLAPVLTRTGHRFEGGFLHAARLKPRSAAPTAALVGHPAWTTLRELEVADYAWHLEPEVTQLLCHPVLRDLRLLDGNVPQEAFWTWVDDPLPRPLLHLTAHNLDRTGQTASNLPAEHEEQLQRCRGCPDLRSLALRHCTYGGPDQLAWLLDAPLGRRIEALEAFTGMTSLGQWIAPLRRQPNLSRFRLSTYHQSWHFVLTRDDTQTDRFKLAVLFSWPSTYECGRGSRSAAAAAATVIEALPAGALTEVHFTWRRKYAPAKADQARLDAAVARACA